MTLTRGIPLSAHGAIEGLAAPAVMVVPFLLGFGATATAICIAFGAVLLALALQVEGPSRVVSLAAHAGFDYALAVVAISAGLAIALATAALGGISLLVGIGIAQVALTASTRFTAPRGAH